jgi:hypothetical protein
MIKQTAVEWLEEQYYESEGKLTRHDFEQAKQMEKDQIINSWVGGKGFLNGEQYYNETYRG